jgi:hypothetical protein
MADFVAMGHTIFGVARLMRDLKKLQSDPPQGGIRFDGHIDDTFEVTLMAARSLKIHFYHWKKLEQNHCQKLAVKMAMDLSAKMK